MKFHFNDKHGRRGHSAGADRIFDGDIVPY